MTFLMVKCPGTGQVVSAGIGTEGIDRLPKVGTRMRCPLCGEEHFWTSRDVWFAEPAARHAHIDAFSFKRDTRGVNRW
jgi:hypothetical protein